MNIYVENISLKSFFFILSFFFNNNTKILSIIYIHSNNRFFFTLFKLLSKIMGFDFKKLHLNFNIKFNNKECLRSLLYCNLLYKFKEEIFKNNFYYSNIHSINNIFLKKYLIKDFTSGHFILDKMKPQYTIILLKNILYNEKNNNKFNKTFIILNNRPWSSIYKKIIKEQNFEIIFKNFFNLFYYFNSRNLFSYLYKFSKIYYFLYFLFNNFFYFINKISSNYLMTKTSYIFNDHVLGYNISKNEYLTDYNFQLYSSLSSKFVGFLSNHEETIKKMQNNEFTHLKYKYYYLNLNKLSKIKFINYKNKNKNEVYQYNSNIFNYNIKKIKWINFFKSNNIKIYLTWYKFYNDHIVANEAIREVGGVSCIWERSYTAYPNVENMTVTDIYFSNSNNLNNYDNVTQSEIKFKVCVGLLSIYNKKYLQKKSEKIRKSLHSKGARNIIALFDQNSKDLDGHDLQIENYISLLEELLKNPSIGVILKPKKPQSLYLRLGNEVRSLIHKSIDTGRCYLFDNSGKFQSNIPVALAALSADVSICSNLHAGTSAVESASLNKRTVLLDREGFPKSNFYDYNLKNVIFSNWDDLIKEMNSYFNSKQSLNTFGDWSKIINDFDPYRDGEASMRMGDYLNDLIVNLNKGFKNDDCIDIANKNFIKMWGKDKIINLN